MTMINCTPEWNSATLVAAEGWQVRSGAAYLSTEATGPEDRGVRVEKGQAWPFPAEATVYYRSVGGSAVIAREPVA